MKTYILRILFLLFTVLPLTSSAQDIEVMELQPGLYIYRSFMDIDGQRVPANGVIAESAENVALIDTPWDDSQTGQLLDWIGSNIGKPIAFAVITHAHMDRIGGIDALKARNIPAIANVLTFEEAINNHYSQPDFSFQTDTLLAFGSSYLEVFYPGHGHTRDNSVVYINDHQVLYGGCFIKSSASPTLGNLEDAVVSEWPASLHRVMERYPDRKMVIPGHGDWDEGAIERTLELLEDR